MTPRKDEGQLGGNPTDLLTRNPVEEKQAVPEVITAGICDEEFTTDADRAPSGIQEGPCCTHLRHNPFAEVA